ncbi:hypothetical protein JCM14635_00470 [Megalodesulfovibrio paquesii]
MPVPENACRIDLEHPEVASFSCMLQLGVYVPCPGPCSVRDFLTGPLGLDGEYARDRVQTVFRDGLAVDDLDTAIVKPGTRLALSAALPGLVGATMRKGGALAGMRASITCASEQVGGTQAPFLVKVLFFNQIGPEVCEALLGRGVYVAPETLRHFVSMQPTRFCQALTAHGQPAEPVLSGLAGQQELILLTVAPAPRG